MQVWHDVGMPTVRITSSAAAVLGDPYTVGDVDVTDELVAAVKAALADGNVTGGARTSISALASKIGETAPLEVDDDEPGSPAGVLGDDVVLAAATGTERTAADEPVAAPSLDDCVSCGKAGAPWTGAEFVHPDCAANHDGGDFITVDGLRYRMDEVPAKVLATGDGVAVRGTDGSIISIVRIDRVTLGLHSVLVEGTAIAGRRRGRTAEKLAPTDTVIRLTA